MKRIYYFPFHKFLSVLFLLFAQVALFAQDSTDKGSNNVVPDSTDAANNTVSGNTDWYTQPWVWAVAGAVVLIIIIVLLRGGKTTERKTTITETRKDNY